MGYNRLKVLKYDFKCSLLRYQRVIENLFQDKDRVPVYLFILSPPYAGSTLLHEIISSSPEVSPNNVWGTREGLSLPDVRQLIDYRQRWDPEYKYPLEEIIKKLENYWSRRKTVWLDKSPSFIFRALDLERHLSGSKFIILTRNPYALTRSFMTRDKMDLETAGRFTLKCFQFQYTNSISLKNKIWIKYENLVNKYEKTTNSIIDFVPQLNVLPGKERYKAHNHLRRKVGLTDFNNLKIKEFSVNDIDRLRGIFSEQQHIFSYFEYSI